jgi:hypothetical protein
MPNFSDFYDSSQARDIARGGGSALGVILTEINFLKELIDTTAITGGLSITVVGATTMTNSSDYYHAWSDVVTYWQDNFVLDRSRMDSVMRYFSALGYRIQRQRTGTTDFFQWVISY